LEPIPKLAHVALFSLRSDGVAVYVDEIGSCCGIFIHLVSTDIPKVLHHFR